MTLIFGIATTTWEDLGAIKAFSTKQILAIAFATNVVGSWSIANTTFSST